MNELDSTCGISDDELTERNLKLLQKAKEQGYFIRCIYVLTSNVDVNVLRVESREALGGHGVPEDKIRSRYEKVLKLIPKLVKVIFCLKNTLLKQNKNNLFQRVF